MDLYHMAKYGRKKGKRNSTSINEINAVIGNLPEMLSKFIQGIQLNGVTVPTSSHIVNIQALTGVKVNGTMATVTDGVADISVSSGSVNDVKVNGSSVVTNKVANVSVPVTDVKVNSASVLKNGIADIVIPEQALKSRPFGSNISSGTFLVAEVTFSAAYEDAVLTLLINSGYATVDFTGILHAHVRMNTASGGVNVANVDWLSYTGASIPTMTIIMSGQKAYLYITTNSTYQIFNIQVLTNSNRGTGTAPWVVSDGSDAIVSMVSGTKVEAKVLGDLTLINGSIAGTQVGSYGNKCRRNGNTVSIYVDIKIGSDIAVATVPEGFRPITSWEMGIAWKSSGQPVLIGVYSTGNLSVFGSPGVGTEIIGNLTYLV